MIFHRYVELVHPIWHRAHFKMRWIYISFLVNWLFGSLLCGAHLIPTTQVKTHFLNKSQKLVTLQVLINGGGYKSNSGIKNANPCLMLFETFYVETLRSVEDSNYKISEKSIYFIISNRFKHV